MRSLVWFRDKDLRIRDHRPLLEAHQAGAVAPIFVLEPAFFSGRNPAGLPHRMQLMLEGLRELQGEMEKRGAPLVLLEGPGEEAVPRFARQIQADQVMAYRCSEPLGVIRDTKTEQALGKIPLRLLEGETLMPPGSLRNGQGGPYRVFTPFAKAFLQRHHPTRPMEAPEYLQPVSGLKGHSLPLPALSDLGLSRNPRLLPGGARAAQARLDWFLDQALMDYGDARNRMDLPGTSRLSQDLHFGFLSIDQVWQAVLDAEKRLYLFRVNAYKRLSASSGASTFKNELLWREFAHHLLAEDGSLLERPFRKTFEGFPWQNNPSHWQAWCEGRTGYPVVDAAARSLLQSGFVHNRARMIAASFLTKHLLIDYKSGEAHYLRWLSDGDPACNNLGWQWSAGCGVDAQPYFRIFHPVTQGQRFDPLGRYVREWLPEISELPDKYIHCPWQAPKPILEKAGLRLGQDYPEPIVDHAWARARFLETAKSHLK